MSTEIKKMKYAFQLVRPENLLPYNQQNTKRHFSSSSYEGPLSSPLKDEFDDDIFEPPSSTGLFNAEDNFSEETRYRN